MRKYLIVGAVLMVVATGSAFAEVSFDTTTSLNVWWNSGFSFFPGSPMATDVHRTTANPIRAVGVGLYLDGGPPTGVDLLIWDNVGGADGLPTGQPIAVYNHAFDATGAEEVQTFVLPSPLAAGADLWIGLRTQNWGNLYWLGQNSGGPMVGITHKKRVYDSDQNGTLQEDGGYFGLRRAIRIEDIPEPGSLVALGSGLIGLIGFGLRRRR